ncbi:MAG: helix-turn-helix domain-containing protein [Candidatus Nealsonbacteria bacterium]|nr:helix-turn-helix domain-containing protein [Candidatus Nealsonbacteria bacterium]
MENNQENKLGKKIKSFRLKLELSQDEFARKADIPYTTLTKIETGVIKKPSVFVMAKIAKTLGVNIEDLIK